MYRNLLFFSLLLAGSSLFAQTKVGHVNTGLVLESMPEAAVADSLMRLYQDSLETTFKALEANFEQKYKNLADSVQLVTPKTRQLREQELQGLQQGLQAFQQESARMFETRRSQYLTPLVLKVQASIDSYAKANNYSLILDTSVPGALLYVNEAEDLTEAIITDLQ
jgi:outer membrane protein